MEGKEAGTCFPFEKAYYVAYIFLIKFSRISYTVLHLRPFLSDVNQIFKDKCSIWMNRASLFIVKGERFYEWFFGIREYLSQKNSKLIMKDTK